LTTLSDRQRALALVRGLPHFSALALVTVVVLAATGTLNTTMHLTSPLQFLTTAYGLTLAVKIEIFLVMAGVSAYHAFWLRPALASALVSAEGESSVGAPGTRPTASAVGASDYVLASTQPMADAETSKVAALRQDAVRLGAGEHGSAEQADSAGRLSQRAVRLTGALEAWLQREAALGIIVLLCVALLAAFAGTLSPAIASPASPTGGGISSGPYISTPVVHNGVSVSLTVDPDRFGTNTFTVTLKDANGHPISGAGVIIATQMLDMDMGVQTAQLQPTNTPGIYSGQSDLTMAGNWQITVKVLPPNSKDLDLFPFKLAAGY
jgi:copper transport protein